MNNRKLVIGMLALSVAAGFSLQAADKTQLFARSGSKMRLEGTSNIHDWQVEGSLIGGSIEVGQNFPTEPGQACTAGKVEAKGAAFVTVLGLKSIEKDGKPYSDKMDEIMYEKLKSAEQSKILFQLDDLTLKEPAKGKEDPYSFEATGQLAVAGVTNKLTMPVKVLPLGEGKVKISGATTVKMTDFKIEPPAPKIALGMIKTGDEVKIIFDWMVAQRKAAAK
jgi:hypothetical protein